MQLKLCQGRAVNWISLFGRYMYQWSGIWSVRMGCSGSVTGQPAAAQKPDTGDKGILLWMVLI